MARRGGADQGKRIFSGDYDPPAPWRLFGIKLRSPRSVGGDTEKTIGALSNAEFFWLGRVWEAEFQRRYMQKKSVTNDA